MTRNQKLNINQLRTFIFEKSDKEYGKQTINGLFRTIIEPLIDNNRENANVFLRLKDTSEVKSVIKRLTFSDTKIYSFSDTLSDCNITNIEKEDIWESVEFVLLLSSRYSVAMIWDYNTSQSKDMSELCLLYNTKSISDVAKEIFSNSKLDFSDYLKKFQPDRRENTALNSSIRKLAGILEDLNREVEIGSFSQNELGKSEKNLENYEQATENIRFICHEIKNHLSIINLYSTITQKKIEKANCDEETEKSLNSAIKNIQNSSSMISRLLNDLKCFSKAEIEPTNIHLTVKTAVEMAKAKAEEKDVELKFGGDEGIIVKADEIKLQNILLNLIYNAIDAVKDKGEVNISWEKQGSFAKILVQDNGEGIDEKSVDKIFEMNFTTKPSGNGLGLPICKTLIKEQNGELNLLMTGKKGSVFEILLPLE